MKIDKLKSYLGFAIRSGKVIFGVDKLMESKKFPIVVLICSTQNDKVTNKVIRYCSLNNISYYKLKSGCILGDIIGRDNCKVIGVNDFNLANAIKNEFQMENEIG